MRFAVPLLISLPLLAACQTTGTSGDAAATGATESQPAAQTAQATPASGSGTADDAPVAFDRIVEGVWVYNVNPAKPATDSCQPAVGGKVCTIAYDLEGTNILTIAFRNGEQAPSFTVGSDVKRGCFMRFSDGTLRMAPEQRQGKTVCVAPAEEDRKMLRSILQTSRAFAVGFDDPVLAPNGALFVFRDIQPLLVNMEKKAKETGVPATS